MWKRRVGIQSLGALSCWGECVKLMQLRVRYFRQREEGRGGNKRQDLHRLKTSNHGESITLREGHARWGLRAGQRLHM